MPTDELKMINAFIGFCKPMGSTWPSPLQPLGYDVVGVERELQTLLNESPREIVPELICASSASDHALCMEAKSQSLRVVQARAYMALKSQELVAQGLLPFTSSSLTHDTVYVSESIHGQAITKLLISHDIRLPLVILDERLFRLGAGTFGNTALQQLFSVGVAIQSSHQWPTSFVQFNSKSSDAEMAGPVVGALSKLLIKGGSFSLAVLAE